MIFNKITDIKRLNLLSAAFFCLILIILSLSLAWSYAHKSMNQELYSETQQIHDQLLNRVLIGQSGLDSLSSMFAAMPHADAEGFRIVSQRFIQEYPFLSSVAYFHFTRQEQRTQFEQLMSERGYSGFSIKQDLNGSLQAINAQQQYLPLIYIEPFEINTVMLLGLDIYNNKQLQTALNQSINSTKAHAVLAEGALKKIGPYWMLQALYAGKTFHNRDANEKDLRGILGISFELDKLLYDIRIANDLSVELLLSADSKASLASIDNYQEEHSLQLIRMSKLDISNQGLWIKVVKSVSIDSIPKRPFYLALMLSITITILIFFLVRSNIARQQDLIKRNEEISHQVSLKTAALEATKNDLEKSLSAITEQETKYRILFDQAGDGIYLHDNKGQILEANQSICDILEYDAEEICNLSITAFQPHHSKNNIADEQLQYQLKKTRQLKYETQFKSKTGLLVYGEVTSKLLNIPGKKVIQSVFRNTTERKRAEDSLKHSENFLSNLFNAITNGVSVLDRDFNVIRTNLWMEKHYADRMPLVGKKCYQVYRHRSSPCTDCPSIHAAASGESKTEIVQIPSLKGKSDWLEISVYPVKNEHGMVNNIIESVRNITDRMDIENKLGRFRHLMDQSNDAIFVFEADSARIIDANMAACLSLGYEKNDLMQLHIWHFNQNFHNHSEWLSWLEELKNNPSLLFESNHVSQNQSIFPVEISTQFINDKEEAYVVAIARDISQLRLAQQALQESEKKYRMLIETSSEGFWMIDPNLNTVDVNNSLCKMLGYKSHEIIGRSIFDFVDARNKKVFQQQTAKIPSTEHRRYEINLTRKNGSSVPTIVGATTIRDDSRQVMGAFAFITDITERKQAEEKLQLAANVFTHANEGIIITDAQAIILDVNDSFSRITGYSHTEVLGKNPRLLRSGHQDSEYYTAMWSQLKEQGSWLGEIWNRRKNGEVYAEMLSINAVYDAEHTIQYYVGLFSDITSQKDYQKQLEQIAHYDPLTKLPNRVLFADRLIQTMAQIERRKMLLAVVYLDLDGFKEINDNYGHDMGDKLLITLTSRLKDGLREGDTIARLGGDEFVAVLVDLSEQGDCIPMLNRLLSSASQPVNVNQTSLRVSASLGVTFFPQSQSVDAEQLVRQADQAMYQAKQAGKNRFKLFDTKQDRNVRNRHESLERIRQALFSEEFILFYQPKVNMHNGKVIGVEALIRWEHPQQGLLLPKHFLPIIETDPLAIEIGEWVIDTALEQLAIWHKTDLKLSLSINIGPYHLQQPNFVERLKKKLAGYPNLDTQYIELELLETSALNDVIHVSKVIRECRAIGVKFSIDDFGTGYSSLTYLKNLPAEILKVDRSLISNMLNDPDDLAILEGILGLSLAFQRQVIAEGVESKEHGILLLQLGCLYAQGFEIAEPMPPESLPNWLSSWVPDPSWKTATRINSDDISLLFAGIEHRAWIKEITNYIVHEESLFPPIKHTDCRFGQWLNGEGKLRYSSLEEYGMILPLHKKIHKFGEELVALKNQGNLDEATNKIPRLNQFRDELLGHLNQLLTKSQKQQ